MKRIIFYLLFSCLFVTGVNAQQTVVGIILDENKAPLGYVNVFIKETLEGSCSDENGYFKFRTEAKGKVLLVAMMLGYDTVEKEIETYEAIELIIEMRPSSYQLKEVQITAGSFNLQGTSRWQTMNAVDIATTGGSVGDLYKSLSSMPGTQAVGESGKLFIRGGESREAQTYIDDMHVLNAYTTNTANEPVRGRYSPFMFSGMTFSLGGYESEYSQGLSSILPLTTKDESPVSKYGVNPSTVGLAGGGTYAFTEGSASVNLDYQNMGPYFAVAQDGRDWNTPYQKISLGSQFRYEPDDNSIAKIYGGYDRTWFNLQESGLAVGLDENNYYLNSTYRRTTSGKYDLFGGAAFSLLDQQYSRESDKINYREWELHMKAKLTKRYSSVFRLSAGMESMIREYGETYQSEDVYRNKVGHSIHGLYTTSSFYFSDLFNLSLSGRLEYTTVNRNWNVLPRAAVNFNPGKFTVSATAGRYSQLPENSYLLQNPYLSTENCMHYILGGYHQSNGKVYRVEGYYKQYDKLAVKEGALLSDSGNGYSKGVDVFFYDASLIRNFEYRVSHSYNLSERKYGEYPVRDVPQFATKHNVSVSLRLDVPVIKSIIGLTNRFASGRPYHYPNKAGWMNSRTPFYNTLDLSYTFLANKKLIIFASVSNILARKNIYNYIWADTPDSSGVYKGMAVRNQQSQFFYIGFFFTLGGNTAYDVSNF